MSYKEYYNIIINEFKNSIQTKDKQLYKKILYNMVRWYKSKYEEKIKKSIDLNSYSKIISITNQINRVCKLNDINKLKETYIDKEMEKFINISSEIFNLVKDNQNGKKTLSIEEYNNYINILNSFERTISPIFINDYKIEKSECILDLEFLKNGNNCKYYSIRASHILF